MASKDGLTLERRLGMISFEPLVKQLAAAQTCSTEHARRLVREYKRLLHLKAATRGSPKQALLIASERVNQCWEQHMLNPKKYFDDCLLLNGELLDHNPKALVDEAARRACYAFTLELYLETFGAEAPEEWWPRRGEGEDSDRLGGQEPGCKDTRKEGEEVGTTADSTAAQVEEGTPGVEVLEVATTADSTAAQVEEGTPGVETLGEEVDTTADSTAAQVEEGTPGVEVLEVATTADSTAAQVEEGTPGVETLEVATTADSTAAQVEEGTPGVETLGEEVETTVHVQIEESDSPTPGGLTPRLRRLKTRNKRFYITLQTRTGNRSRIHPTAGADTTLETVQQQIQEAEGIPIAQQRLMLGCHELVPGKTLSDYAIDCGTVVSLRRRLTRW